MRIRDSLHNDHLPDTYYRSSCNDLAPFSRLEGSVRTQVCVIGGGFSGVATAVELAERGFSVALVEQNNIGWGASGRSGGQILSGPTDFSNYEMVFGAENASSAWRMNTEGAEIIRERVAKYSLDCDLKWGGVEIARTASEDAGLQAKVASLKLREGVAGMEYIDKAQIDKYVVSDRIISGLYRSDWGRCHPLKLVRGEARAAEALGVKIYEDARVNKVSFGEQVVVDTGHGKVTADRLVLAGNAYLGKLVPDLTERFISVGTYLMATEPLLAEDAEMLFPKDLAVRGLGDSPLYFHLTPDNRLLFGALNSHTGKHPKNLTKVLTHKLHSLFPELAEVKCDRAWGGFIGVGEKRILQIGQLADNVFYTQAYGGRGVGDSHLAGRLIAEAIDGDRSRFNVLGGLEHPTYKRGGLFRRSMNAIERVASAFNSKA